MCGKSTEATITSGSILFVGILPGQQVMVCSINSVKTDDSFYSFFIHVMIMQALSDNRAARSNVAGATTQPCGWLQTTRSLVYLPCRMGRVRPGHTWHELGGSTNSLVSVSVWLEPDRDKSAIEVATLPPG